MGESGDTHASRHVPESADKRGRKQKSLPPDERIRRDEFARALFAQNPSLDLKVARQLTEKEFGQPLSNEKLSAIRAAYLAVRGMMAPQQAPWPLSAEDVEDVKTQLRELLKIGRSPQRDTPLLEIAQQLVDKRHALYDEKFAEEMKRVAPPWFFVGKRKLLLDMARMEKVRPSRVSQDPMERQLAQSLSALVTLSSNSYDEDFDRHIRRLRPDWFQDRRR